MDYKQYINDIKDDCIDFIDDNINYYDDFESLYDEMCLVVTGNDVGSYYCNSFKAKEAVEDAIWDNDIIKAVKDLGYHSGIPTDDGPEACDVIIRCALIYHVYNEVQDYFDELKEETDCDE